MSKPPLVTNRSNDDDGKPLYTLLPEADASRPHGEVTKGSAAILSAEPEHISLAPRDKIFDGPGEMRERCRAFDWSLTALGPSIAWPLSLRTTVATMLASSFPMFLWSGPELIQIYNDAYRPSLGLGDRHTRALGAEGANFWTEIWPVIGPQIWQVMGGGPATFHEDQLVPIERNGKLEDVYWTYSFNPAFDDGGNVSGVLVVCQETTARINSAADREQLITAERRARADADAARETTRRVFAQAPVAVGVLEGRELRYTAANLKYREMIGNRDPVGLTLTEMFPELLGSEAERILHGVYDSGRPFFANDFLIRFDSQATGELDNYYDLVYHPLAEGDGQVTGIVVVAIDVTARNNSIRERDLLLSAAERAVKEADSANKAKTDFLAVMSHELRTPLNAIGGYVELIELEVHGPVTPQQRVALERIQRSQRHLLGLINGVLNFVKVDAGAVHYEIVDVPLDEVLATCEALVAPQMHAKRVEFKFDGCGAHITARADSQKVQQVILNLLSNAVKFTDPGGHVRMSCEVAGENEVLISVADTGQGIPEDQLERIFLPFVQVDVKLTRTQQGTGLGLAISRDLARAMGGDLTVAVIPAGGSMFSLTLPRGGLLLPADDSAQVV